MRESLRNEWNLDHSLKVQVIQVCLNLESHHLWMQIREIWSHLVLPKWSSASEYPNETDDFLSSANFEGEHGYSDWLQCSIEIQSLPELVSIRFRWIWSWRWSYLWVSVLFCCRAYAFALQYVQSDTSLCLRLFGNSVPCETWSCSFKGANQVIMTDGSLLPESDGERSITQVIHDRE